MNTLGDHLKAGFAAAIEAAQHSLSQGGIPIGAALVSADGAIIATGHNQRVQLGDPTAHGEIDCIRKAGRRRDWHTLTLITTLTPCSMCSGTAILFKIPRVVIGENQTFQGREDWLKEAGTDLVILNDSRCIQMMQDFINANPDLWNEDIGIPD